MGGALGGSGGGRSDFAQAGGKDPGTLGPAFQAARDELGALLEKR
jgi:alanyl-tRNA synthetase